MSNLCLSCCVYIMFVDLFKMPVQKTIHFAMQTWKNISNRLENVAFCLECSFSDETYPLDKWFPYYTSNAQRRHQSKNLIA